MTIEEAKADITRLRAMLRIVREHLAKNPNAVAHAPPLSWPSTKRCVAANDMGRDHLCADLRRGVRDLAVDVETCILGEAAQMRYWFDTEFIEDGRTIDLISIGIVAEDGREFYAESNECDLSRASPWVKQNVIPHLIHGYEGRVHMSRKAIANAVQSFCGEKPEIWAYYASYDWVVLCQLFGTMMELPSGWPMLPYDVKQLCDDLGNPKLPEQGKGEHHALADARWTRQAWEFLQDIRERGQP